MIDYFQSPVYSSVIIGLLISPASVKKSNPKNHRIVFTSLLSLESFGTVALFNQ